MSQAVLRIPTPLRSFTGGVDELRVEGRNVRELLRQLAQQHPGLEPRLFDDSGELRRFINVYVDGRDIRSLHGLDTTVSEGQVLALVPAVAGGGL